ncbi:hypothetical protein [Prosthecobacter sp.]|uniref:hypothetical protein n=1 Tax=Prosthecobacter sp. TaxID=1965333 RepID=UPI003783BD08
MNRPLFSRERWLLWSAAGVAVLALGLGWLAERARRETAQALKETRVRLARAQASGVNLMEEAKKESLRIEEIKGQMREKDQRLQEQEWKLGTLELELRGQTESLHEASRADHALAVQRMEADGNWSEGLALLARALQWWPENPQAATRLYAALSLHAAENQGWPRKVLRHAGPESWPMLGAVFCADGSRFLTRSADKTLRVWDAKSGEAVGVPVVLPGQVQAAELSPDGKRIVTVMGKGYVDAVQLWEVLTGRQIGRLLLQDDRVRSVHFGAEGARLVSVSHGGTSARVWDVATQQPLGAPLAHAGGVHIAEFSRDGSLVVTASADKAVQVWEVATGKPLGKPLLLPLEVEEAHLSPDGAQLLTLTKGMDAQIWDVPTWQPHGEPLGHGLGLRRAAYSPDGASVLAIGDDDEVLLWSAMTGQRLGAPLRHAEMVMSASFSRDGTRVVSKDALSRLQVWDVASGKRLGVPLRHAGSVETAEFSPDGRQILTACYDGTALLWDVPPDHLMGEPFRHADAVLTAAFSPDGKRLLTGSDDDTAQVWDVSSGRPVGVPMKHENRRVWGVEFSADGKRVLTASSDSTARVWDAATGLPVTGPLRPPGQVWEAHFSTDGTRVLTVSQDGSAQLWDAATGKPLGAPMWHEEVKAAGSTPVDVKALGGADGLSGEVQSAEFSRDGRRILTAGADGTARLWDGATCKRLDMPALTHEAEVTLAHFSPDGTLIVTRSEDDKAKLWNASTGKPLELPLLLATKVRSAAFSPDSKRVVTVGEDNAAQVWDVATGKPLGAPMLHDRHLGDAAFSPDGTLIVTTSDDEKTRVWDAATGLMLGEPLHHMERGPHQDFEGNSDFIPNACFSPDGRCIVTTSIDDTARLWHLPPPASQLVPVPEWVRARAYAVAGLEPGPNGELREMSPEQRLNALRAEVPKAGAQVEWSKLALWLALPASERPFSPASRFTRSQVAERERDAH